MTNTAFITGVTGQHGTYLAAFLLDKGYIVHGLGGASPSSTLSASTTSTRVTKLRAAASFCTMAT